MDVGIRFKWTTYDRLEFSEGGYNFGYAEYEKRVVVDVEGRVGVGDGLGGVRGKGKLGEEATKSRRDVVSVARTSSDSPSDCPPLCRPTRTNERMNSKTLSPPRRRPFYLYPSFFTFEKKGEWGRNSIRASARNFFFLPK